MAVGAAVFAGVVLLLCAGLFLAGVRMDESSASRPATTIDAAPMRRAVAALQYENDKLRRRINATAMENERLRARLRLQLPPRCRRLRRTHRSLLREE